MLCWEYPRKKVRLYLVFVAGFYADEVGRYLTAVQVAPCIDYFPHRPQQILRSQYRPRGLAGKISLGKIICDTPGVVHMPVCEQNITYRNNLVGGLADVEADIQLRDCNHGLLTRDRIADDFQIVYLDMC